MILDNVKIRLAQMRDEIDFIKECLWQGRPWKAVKRASGSAVWRRILSWPSAGSRNWQESQKSWR